MGLFGSGKKPPTRMRVTNPNDVGNNLMKRQNGKGTLTAAGQRVGSSDANTIRRLQMPWQQRVFLYYDIVPEIKYAGQFYARSLSVLRLFPAYMNDDGELEETDDPQAIEQLDRIQDPGGGRSGLLSSYGRLLFLTGEAILFCSIDTDTGREQWEMLSTDELRVTDSGYLRIKAPSLQQEEYHDLGEDDYDPIEDDQAVAYRIWRRHPHFSQWADASMQGVLDVCEELVLLTAVIRARARSRMAGPGILLINGAVTPVPVEPVPDEDAEEDPFLRDFIKASTAAITDESSASSVVPLIVRVDVDKEDGGLDNVMKHIQIIDPMQIYPETGLRRELIDRLAIGLDMPAEVLTGIADVNHWGAWQIDEQTWKAHLQPVAQQFVDDLTAAFYQPTLRELGKEDWDRYYIAYDAAAVINHPDRSKDANELFDRNAIGKHALREAKNFSDEDAPTEEESNESIGRALRDGSYVKYGIPSKLGTGGIEPEEGQVVSGVTETQGGPGDTTPGATGPADVSKGPPPNDQPVAASANGNGHGVEVYVARILGASDLALYRARELAGARLRTAARKHTATAEQIDGVPNHKVAATLGRDACAEITNLSEVDLIAGSRDFMLDAIRLWKLPDEVTEAISRRIEQHAAKTLWDEHPPQLPTSFVHYVTGVYEAAQ